MAKNSAPKLSTLLHSLPLKTIGVFLVSLLCIGLGIMWAVRGMRVSEGMWRTFDDVQTARTIAMAHELKLGQFPVRNLSDFGNGGGYLLFNFYSPLIYYISAGLVLLGSHPLHAVKLTFQLCYLIAGLGMFLWLRKLFISKAWIAVLGSLLFIGSSYFNYDVYLRGALAELSGFALIPWVFWAYEEFKTSKTKLGILLLAVCVSALVYAHAITVFITIPFLALRFLIDLYYQQLNRSQIIKLILAALLATGLAASYLFPMLKERSLMQYSQIDNVTSGFKNSFVSFPELIGWNKSTDPAVVPLTLGFWLATATAIGAVVNFIIFKKGSKNNQANSLFWFSLLALILVVVIQSKWSWWFWERSSLLQMIQFQYRYLTFTTLVAVLGVCLALNNLKIKWLSFSIGIVLLLATWQSNQVFMTPVGYYFSAEFNAEDPCSTTTWQHEFLSLWTKECLPKGNGIPAATASGELAITQLQQTGGKVKITTNGKPGELYLTKYYFPGWQLTNSTESLPLRPFGSQGIIAATVSGAGTEYELAFKNTPIRTFADRATLFSLLLVGIGLVWESIQAIKRCWLNYAKF
jgi:hypothetical protein